MGRGKDLRPPAKPVWGMGTGKPEIPQGCPWQSLFLSASLSKPFYTLFDKYFWGPK